MHDFLDILGVPTDAAASEVRRACARRIRRTHPDFADASSLQGKDSSRVDDRPADVAIDFADMRVFVDRIQVSFFGRPRALGNLETGPLDRPAAGAPDADRD